MLIKKLENLQRSDFKVIPVGRFCFAIVDPDDYEHLSKFYWRLRRSGHCFYAVRRVHRNGKSRELKMHREIAKTPQGYECHHVDHSTLNNRKSNLENRLPSEHSLLHKGYL